MSWFGACISISGVGDIVGINEIMNTERYQQIMIHIGIRPAAYHIAC